MSSSSIVQIAFDPNDEPVHCGYCKTDGSCTIGVIAPIMTVDDYQLLMDRGWRKCGTYFYKALMEKTCCPLYTIRCDANNFRISRSQRRVIRNMNLFINENIKPDAQIHSISSNSNTCDLQEWIQTEPSTRAIELIRHILFNDTPPTTEFLQKLKSRQKRWYRKLLKLKLQNKLTLQTDIRVLIKRYKPMQISSLEQIAEWLIYQNEKIPNEWFEKIDGYHPIDYYWKNVFTLKTNTGADKFVALAKLVKYDRSLLSDASINGLRATRDGVTFFGNGKPHEVPITKGLLDSVRDAHARYCIDLEKQRQELFNKKKIESESITKNLFIEKENGLYDEQKCLQTNLNIIQKLIDEGTERLATAISSKDFKEIETAQLLIEGGNKKLAVTNTQIACNNNQLHQLRKKQKKS